MYSNFPWLSLILFLPLVSGLIALLTARGGSRHAGGVALAGSLATLALSLGMGIGFQTGFQGYQLEERCRWIPSIGAEYHLGVDGISVWLAVLTAFLAAIVIIYVLPRQREHGPGLLVTILALETSILGVLFSVDVLLFYIFWEAMLIPMYFLIAVWGGERRGYAGLKFILYMMLGSLLMLVGILWFYWEYHASGRPLTFDLSQWITLNSSDANRLAPHIQSWIFFFFFLSFAIKVPLFPFHTWLPEAQEQAPVPFNVMLVEVGAYGFIRFCLPLVPAAAVIWTPLIMTLATVSVIYGAVMAVAQPDLKRLLAYAGMSHGGFMMLGIFSMTIQGLDGAVLYMVNAGLTGGALFIIADLLERRRGSRLIADFGGLAGRMPHLFFIFMVVMLGAAGLPGLNGFTGEFLVLLGAIRSGAVGAGVVSPVYGYAAGLGVVLSVVYMLWMFQRVMFGSAGQVAQEMPDLGGREKLALWPVVLVIFFIGFGSSTLTRPMFEATHQQIEAVQQGVTGLALPSPEADRVPNEESLTR
jgi:NADH-quinone oxidoreductase subunit M